jgi:transposase
MNIKISISTIYKFLKRLKITYKRVKTKYYYKSIQILQEKINTYKSIISKISDDKILCIDETYFDPNLKSNYAWSPSGTPISHYKEVITKKQSLIAIISNTKVLSHKLYNGNINSTRFLSFLKDSIGIYKDHYILMDNVRFHKTKEVTEYISNCNSVLYIPPYSPQFNPIEEVFSQIKNYIRQGLKLTHAFQKVTENNLRNYFSHMRKII